MDAVIAPLTQILVPLVSLALVGLAAIVAGADSRPTIADDHRR